MKATHRGTCQRCGATQKLPDGRLSTHGYTVKWGFFSGNCIGSGELPYEQSCDLCKESITWAENRMEELDKEIHKWSVPARENKAWVHVYVGHGVYSWQQVELIETSCSASEFKDFYYVTTDGKKTRLNLYGKHPETALEAVTICNQGYASKFNHEIRELQGYINWQQFRVDEWKPRRLQEIKQEPQKQQHSYTYQGGKVDLDGWYKIRLLRDDGRVVKVNKSRYRALREKGQIVEDKTCEEP